METTDKEKRLNYQVALDVIAGKYGNGVSRMNALAEAGYDGYKVQSIVNAIIYDGYKIDLPTLEVEVDLSKYSGITLKFKGAEQNEN